MTGIDTGGVVVSKFQCPKCKSGSFRLFEHLLVSDAIFIEGGEVVERHPSSDVQSTGSFSAECGCGHRWCPRRNTGERAVDRAQELGVNQ